MLPADNSAETAEVYMRCAYATNIGAKRKINQDACLAAEIENDGIDYYVFAAADGLGGHRSGEVASQMAVDYIQNFLTDVNDYSNPLEMDRFVNAINAEIVRASIHDPELSGMATTLTLAILGNHKLAITQIGDSRAYRINSKGLSRLTKDHSLVQMLIDEGRLDPKDASRHPQKNVITRALGTDSMVTIDLYEYDVCPTDIFLVCTDGLYNMVSEEEILRIVRENSSLESAVKELINTANDNGGNDNITVLLFTENGKADE